MPVHIEARLVRLPHGFNQRRRVLQKRDAQIVRAGFDRESNFQMLIDAFVPLITRRRFDGERVCLVAIEQHRDFVRTV